VNSKAAVILESLAYFLGGATVTYLGVQYGIPYLEQRLGIDPVSGWFLTSGGLVLVLFAAAVASARHRTGARSFQGTLAALNLRPMNRADIVWVIGGLFAVVALTGTLITVFSKAFAIDLLSKESYGSFLQLGRLEPHQYWVLAVWFPYFFVNITGEELLWRGYLLPRQAVVTRRAWILNGLLWTVFHSALGWRIGVVLLPIEFVVPYVVQKRRNTWLGIIIHGLYNGSGFLSVAFGLV
jgi:membrane protease YdiL (CAAX protease family)